MSHINISYNCLTVEWQREDVTFRSGCFSVQTPLGYLASFEMKPHYEPLGNLWVEVSIRKAVSNMGSVMLSPRQ